MKKNIYIGTHNYYIYYSNVIFRVKLSSHPRIHYCVNTDCSLKLRKQLILEIIKNVYAIVKGKYIQILNGMCVSYNNIIFIFYVIT